MFFFEYKPYFKRHKPFASTHRSGTFFFVAKTMKEDFSYMPYAWSNQSRFVNENRLNVFRLIDLLCLHALNAERCNFFSL